MFGQLDGVWRPAKLGACLAALLVTACSATSGGGGGVFVSIGDAAADGQLSADATPATGDVIVGLDAAAGTDAAGADVSPLDVLQPTDGVELDAVPLTDAPVVTDTAPGLDGVTTTDSGKPGCKSDVACKATNQVCNLASGLCVDCNSKADWSGEQVCVANLCTVQKTCTSSKDCTFVCNKATGMCVECVSDVDCDADKWCGSDFACHPDVCTAGSGTCANNSFFPCVANRSGYASTGQACSSTGACGAGVCSASGCAYSNGASCNDGNACTSNETCKNGACQGGTPATCTDNNPCTTDSCVNGPGCQHVALNCDDGNACTTDSCNANATGVDPCVHTSVANCGTATCGADVNNTCNGKCGQAAGPFGGCSCASDCKAKGTCCADYDACSCGSTTPPTCGADPTNTCKGVCATDTMCLSMLCQIQPTFCRPDWAACCSGP